MEVANTLAYYNTATIAVIKCFIVEASGLLDENGFLDKSS
jgi:hypothetical protein